MNDISYMIDDNLEKLFYQVGDEFIIESGILDEWVEDQFKGGLSQIPSCFGEITDFSLIDIMMEVNEEYSKSGRKRYNIDRLEELKEDFRKLEVHIKDLATQLSRCANCIYFERCLAYAKFKYEKEQDSKISEALDI